MLLIRFLVSYRKHIFITWNHVRGNFFHENYVFAWIFRIGIGPIIMERLLFNVDTMVNIEMAKLEMEKSILNAKITKIFWIRQSFTSCYNIWLWPFDVFPFEIFAILIFVVVSTSHIVLLLEYVPWTNVLSTFVLDKI